MSRNLATALTSPNLSSVPRTDPQSHHGTRGAIAGLVDQLRQLDQQLALVASTIPQPGDTFDLLEEIGVGLRCVQTDLLVDAIKTLESLAYDDEVTLRAQYEERHRLFEIVNG